MNFTTLRKFLGFLVVPDRKLTPEYIDWHPQHVLKLREKIDFSDVNGRCDPPQLYPGLIADHKGLIGRFPVDSLVGP